MTRPSNRSARRRVAPMAWAMTSRSAEAMMPRSKINCDAGRVSLTNLTSVSLVTKAAMPAEIASTPRRLAACSALAASGIMRVAILHAGDWRSDLQLERGARFLPLALPRPKATDSFSAIGEPDRAPQLTIDNYILSLVGRTTGRLADAAPMPPMAG